tara:strand:+ start:81849 stop:82973 length:1125 start_codon:yes stop_codon:yes gene_type:complete
MDTKVKNYEEILSNTDLPTDSENKVLKATLIHLKNELSKFKKNPLILCQVKNVLENKVIIKLPNGNLFSVDVLNELMKKVKINDNVLVEQRSLTVVDVLNAAKNYDIENFIMLEKQNLSWGAIGGLSNQIKEIKEVVELPLMKPTIFEKVGIEPPKGILLYGPSGTGKTLLAKAVASSTKATFIEIIASELNQKYIGEGAKLVKDLFKLARERAPTIIFIDEIDAIASERLDLETSGEREVQRTFMQFLAELDGFKPLDDVKIIGSTNRVDVLDSALLRPGRLDRLIEVDLPNEEERFEIFKIHTKKVNLDSVNLKELSKITNEFSGAEIKAVCTEAGYSAIRDKRYKVNQNDFLFAVNKVKADEDKEHLSMFV